MACDAVWMESAVSGLTRQTVTFAFGEVPIMYQNIAFLLDSISLGSELARGCAGGVGPSPNLSGTV